MNTHKNNLINNYFQNKLRTPSIHKAAFKLVVLLSIGLSLLIGCSVTPAPLRTTSDPSIPLTNAALTAEARGTLEAGLKAVAQLTSLAASSTIPPSPQLPTSIPTDIPTIPPTSTLPPPSPTIPTIPCYRADLISDLSAPPNSLLPTGAAFVKTWRLLNSGSCPWNQQFSLALYGGDPMGSSTFFPLGYQVPPGSSLDLSISLIAPGFAGTHQGNWFLRSPSGENFGVGANAEIPLQVIIRTVQPITYTSNAYDLAFSMCSASWESGNGRLGCPGIPSDAQGSITLLNQPTLESGIASGLTLLTRPNFAIDGWIRARFPAYYVREYDHFLTQIGCLNGSPNCNLIFRLDYQATDGTGGRLGNWRETFDGQSTPIDVDLSGLSGRAIQLILTVENVGNVDNANASWVQPRIQNQTPSNSLVFTWTREGYPGWPCTELRVYMNNSGQGEAQAIACSPYRYELGKVGLSRQDVLQLMEWMQRLSSFDAEISRAAQGNAITTWISFSGLGTDNARDSDLQAINSFATLLFNEVAP